MLQLAPSAVSRNDGFGVLGSLSIEAGQEIVDVERARGGASSGSSSEHTRMLEARIDLLREQVVDTANLWKKKLQRMQEKYDSVSSMLRAEYETKMEKMKRDYGTNRTVLVESIQQSHAKKLQLLFEKFERRKRYFDSTSGKLRSHVQTLSSDFRRVSKIWEREKEDLTRAIEELSAKLAFEREQSHMVASEVQRHMQSQVAFLQKAITLRSMDLQRMQRSVECSLMSAEDMRTRVYSLTARFLHLQKENSMYGCCRCCSLLIDNYTYYNAGCEGQVVLDQNPNSRIDRRCWCRQFLPQEGSLSRKANLSRVQRSPALTRRKALQNSFEFFKPVSFKHV